MEKSLNEAQSAFEGDGFDSHLPKGGSGSFLEAASTALMANPSLTRRSFVSATAVVGALTCLGSVFFSSGAVVTAYADEADNTHFSVYVLSREEVPIMALRETDAGKVAQAGVNITVTSFYNQKQVSVTTSADGFAVVNVRPLSADSDDDTVTQYSCFAKVQASAQGCRDVYFPKEYFVSGVPADEDGTRPNVIEIPIELDDGTPYLRFVTLDDVDVLHSAAPGGVGDYNDIDHTFAVQVASASTSAAVQVALFIDGKERERKTATRMADAPRCALATFTDKYLSIIEPGQEVKIWFSVEGEGAKSAVLPVTFERAIVLKGGYDIQALTIGSDPDGLKDTRTPSFAVKWMFGKEDSFSFGIPGLPLEFYDDTLGNFGASVTILSYTFLREENGQDKLRPEDKFKWFGGKLLGSGVKSWKSTFLSNVNNLKSAYTGLNRRNRYTGASKVSRLVTASADLSAMLYGSCAYASDDPSDDTLSCTGDFALSFKLGINASIGSQFAILYLPFYWNLDFSALIQAKLAIGMAFKNWFEDVKWGHHYDGKGAAQFVIYASVEAGLTFAAGVRGIFGIGLRGYGKVISQLVIDRSSPEHVLHGMLWGEANLQFVLQTCLFSKAIPVWDEPAKLGPLDSWDPPKSLSASGTDFWSAFDSLDFSDAKMISQEVLGVVSEYEGTLVSVEGVDTRDAASAESVDARDAASVEGVEGAEGAGDDTAGLTYGMPATYTRTKLRAPASVSVGLIAAGPASASGFASPYAALDGTSGKLRVGATGTSDLALTGTQADFAQVSTYNPHLGLVPTEQVKLYGDVYSDARMRTFVGNAAYCKDPEDNIVMARLVTVQVSDGEKTYARSRVCVCLWDTEKHTFGTEQVVDFNASGIATANRADVDFDIDVVVHDGRVVLALAVTSIVLEGNTDITFDQAMAKQFVSFMAWDINTAAPLWTYSLNNLLSKDIATYHPRALVQGSANPNATYPCRYCFYYFRKGPDLITNTGIYISTFSQWGNAIAKDISFDTMADVSVLVPCNLLVEGTFEVSSENRSAEVMHDDSACVHTILAWRGGSKCAGTGFVRSFRFHNFETYCDSQVGFGKVASISRRGCQDTEVLFTCPMTSKVACEKKNRVVKYDATQGKLLVEEVDGYSTEADCIASADGKRLYSVHVSEGSPNEIPDDVASLLEGGAQLFSSVHYCADTGANYGGASLTNSVSEPVYQLYESRWIDSIGAYHEFYPIARLSFHPDSVSVLSCKNGSRDFVMTSITDIDAAKCDVYKVSVPDVIAVQCESAEAESPFAAAGDELGFFVEVSNVGNALITGFTVSVTDDAGKVIHEQAYFDLRAYLQESADNYHVERNAIDEPVYNDDGTLSTTFIEDIRDTSGILWPGFMRKYRFSFTMPEGYSGSTEFKVQLSNPRSNPYANDATPAAVFAQVNDAKEAAAVAAGTVAGESGAGAGGAGAQVEALRAEADHLSWLEVDEFSEALFGASVQQIVDPRKRPFELEVQSVSGVASGFSALPARYEIESTGDTPVGGEVTGNTPASDAGATADSQNHMPATGDDASGAVLAAAALAVGAAGVAVGAAHARAKTAQEDSAED